MRQNMCQTSTFGKISGSFWLKPSHGLSDLSSLGTGYVLSTSTVSPYHTAALPYRRLLAEIVVLKNSQLCTATIVQSVLARMAQKKNAAKKAQKKRQLARAWDEIISDVAAKGRTFASRDQIEKATTSFAYAQDKQYVSEDVVVFFKQEEAIRVLAREGLAPASAKKAGQRHFVLGALRV